MADQRKKKRARGISSGTTFFLVSASKVAAKWTFTKLKKYSSPIQVIPEKTWIQRNRMFKISTKVGMGPPRFF